MRDLGGLIDLASDVAALLLEAIEGPLECLADTVLVPYSEGRGVAAISGKSDLRFSMAGIFNSGFTCAGASESGGEGGVGASDAESDFGGGVEAVGDVGVVLLTSLPGLLARNVSTARGLGFRDRKDSIVPSARRSFSSRISLSTLRSPSSSLNLCASILNCSLSFSPSLISSSIKTPLSIETFNLLSRSSKLLVVFLACRS